MSNNLTSAVLLVSPPSEGGGETSPREPTDELLRLRADLARAEQQAANYQQAYLEAEAQSEVVTSLYVALQRIYGDLSREAVLTAVQEIIVNLIGCEQLVVLLRDPDTRRLVPSRVFGIRAHRIDEVTVGEGLLGTAIASGGLWINPDLPQGGIDNEPTASIPLSYRGQVTGAIVLLRLLPHKLEIDSRDRELMQLLSVHAANALALSGD